MSILSAVIVLSAITVITFVIVWGVVLLGDSYDKPQKYHVEDYYMSDEEYLKNGGKIVTHFWGKVRE